MSGDKYKLYKEIREDSARRITRDINDKRKKEIYATRDCYDKSLFDYGVKYHGNPTKEISVEIKNNTNFINGYNYAKRKAEADNFRGSEWFNSGMSLDDSSEEDRSNKYFVDGFNSAKAADEIFALISDSPKHRR